MTLRLYSLLAFTVVLNAIAVAEWIPHNVGTPSNRSMTTFNGTYFLATLNVGIQKSTDGTTWTLANTGLPQTGGQIKAQSVGSNGTTLFCGTESGLYRSMDSGASWALAQSGIPATSSATVYVNKIYNFGGVTFVIYTGTVQQSNGGIFRTVDNGNTWLQAFNGLQTNMTVYNIDQAGGALYAATSTSLMKSVDLGQSWQQVPNVNYAVYAVQGIAGRVVALTTFGAKYSVDEGLTWTNSTNYPVANPAAGSELIYNDNKFFAITRSGSLGCYRSLDGGATWEAFNTGLSTVNTFAQEEFHASGDELFIVCAMDLYSTTGSSVGMTNVAVNAFPAPFPTAFTDGFQIDLTSQPTGATVVLIDAGGREAMRRSNLPATLVRIERNGLAKGLYHCMLIDARSGSIHQLGSVIAQ